jgi:hypothetical protein
MSPQTARADTVILETAAMGERGHWGGILVDASQFIAARFHLEHPMPVTRVGGHFTTGQNGAAGEIFTAIVHVAGPSAFPTGLPFTPHEVMASTLITIPTGLSAELLVPLPVVLPAGDYLVVFGSGLFGATGEGSLTTVNRALGPTTFPRYDNESNPPYWSDALIDEIGDPNLTMRIVVRGDALDEDDDGVSDDTDFCPGTPQGSIVNSQGCSIAQLAPCSGPLSGGLWRNHGDYLSAVQRVADDFHSAGLIAPNQKTIVLRAAARSSCGR